MKINKKSPLPIVGLWLNIQCTPQPLTPKIKIRVDGACPAEVQPMLGECAEHGKDTD